MGSVNEGAMEAIAVNLSNQKPRTDWVICRGHDGVSCMRKGLRTRYGASPMVSLAAGVAGSTCTNQSGRYNNLLTENIVDFFLHFGQ
ncbi:hypothetical protein D3C85_1105790 [compost metagenome]